MSDPNRERIATAAEGRIKALARALDCKAARDACGDPAIIGKHGNVHADSAGWSIYVDGKTARRWGVIKRVLAFCRVTQDGDADGCLWLDRLPTPTEARTLRKVLRIPKRRTVSPETAERLRAFSATRRAGSGVSASGNDERKASGAKTATTPKDAVSGAAGGRHG
ncbi:MAG TPA: hypothetical protein VGP72_31695 [Planctomycetota bacterium]|jgi:hypothetical protein